MKPFEAIEEYLKSRPQKNVEGLAWKTHHPDKYQEAISLYKQGMNLTDIAFKVGCNYDTLRNTFMRDNIHKPKRYI